MLPPYLDQLSPERQEVFKLLRRFSAQFTLAGGTAIMLQIGHRMSFDFDCFTAEKLSSSLLRKARDVFGRIILPRVQTPEQLTFTTGKSVEVTFVYHPYRPLRKPTTTDSMPIFHLDDLAANKAYTVGRRGIWRDYVDLFFLLKWNLYTIDHIVALAKKKFEGEFHDKLFLEQLSFFDDVEILPTTFLKDSYTPSEIQSFLEEQVEAYVRKILP